MDKSLKILISGLLDTETTARDINKQISRLTHKLDRLKINVQIDDNILKTMNQFSEQMKRIQGDALQAGKRIEEVLLPDGTKVKTTSFDNLHKSMEDLVVHANNAKKVSDQVSGSVDELGKNTEGTKKAMDTLNSTLGENAKVTSQVITENAKGQRIYQNTEKNLKNNTQLTTKYNEDTKELTKTLKINHEQEQKRLDSLRKVAQERAKLRRELTGMQQDGTISNSQFNDLSGRLINVKNTQDLNRYKESMSNLVAETNKATTTQTKLNQAQGNFRVTLQNLQSQGKITEQQLKQFSNAVNTTKSVGQVKRLSDEIDKLKIKASQGSNGLLNPFDTDMALRKFDNRASESLRQFPSINRDEIAKIQSEMKKLASTTGLTRQQVQHFNQSLTETVTKTKQVTANTNTMAGALQNAMLKFP